MAEVNGGELDGDIAEAVASEAVKGGLDTECGVQEANAGAAAGAAVQQPHATDAVAEAAAEATKGGLDTVQEVDTSEANVASPTQTHRTNNDRPPPTQACALRVIEHKQAATSDMPDTLPYRGKPPPAVTA